MGGYQLEFNNITKTFPGVKALEGITFKACPGEILALVGENGAGKSTLLKILNGDYHPNTGDIILDGKVQHFANPKDALDKGISILYQERHVVPYLSVAENLFIGELPHIKSFVKWDVLYRKAEKLLAEIGLECSPKVQVKHLSVAQQQMVEIAKDYHRNVRVMAFDEPTASLSGKEIEVLFRIIKKLKGEGVTIVYVSHRMNEIFELADNVAVLKDGRYMGTVDARETTRTELIRMMTGRDISTVFAYVPGGPSGEECFSVRNLTNKHLHNVSFSVKKSEILGIAGLVGAGRSELAHAVFGADRLESGEMFLDGEKIVITHPQDAIQAGIALCPEDRKQQALILKRPIRENISNVVLHHMSRLGFIKRRQEQAVAADYQKSLRIKTPHLEEPIKNLSGGNQQKAVLSRWLACKPKVLILDEPTRGIDVGAKTEIYEIINRLKHEGMSIIMISSELPEILGISDRILVMRHGTIAGELTRAEASEEKILDLAMTH
ncbi:hypothetical protein CSA56_15030 [candidate division KSB3 bacterium]|uniref:ABC transporter domain-containing protein n=1 Tax=candidate division KSB3 bacterium TaxID=2044937 RepID=A0A2G6K9X8_9BACT|nr:MAG: hypothetical protein CSA56_15030 [candidate division KSB3 bacterium]